MKKGLEESQRDNVYGKKVGRDSSFEEVVRGRRGCWPGQVG